MKAFQTKINPCANAPLLACLYLPIIILGCSNGPMNAGSSNDAKKVTISKNGENADDENSLADLPSEIAGSFLTCSYVTPKESGFSPSDTNMPVGCAVMMGEDKVKDDRYSYKLKLYNTQNRSQPLATKLAPESSSWHHYGELGRYGNHDKNLGMTIVDRQSGVEYKPLLFPVRNLRAKDTDAILNLAGGYKSGGDYGRAMQNGKPTLFAEAGIIPAAYCDGGKRRPVTDLTKDTSTIMGLPVIQGVGEMLDNLTGKQGEKRTSNLEIRAKETRAKETQEMCLQKTKIRDLSSKSIASPVAMPGGGEYVVEGDGCLFTSYFDDQGTWRVMIYDQQDRVESGIVKEHLETFVKHHIDQRSNGKSKVKCPEE